MEKLITVTDVKERYGCSGQTARKYIRQCNPHMEKPLTTPEWAFREWEQGRVVCIETYDTKITSELIHMCAKRTYVPRRR